MIWQAANTIGYGQPRSWGSLMAKHTASNVTQWMGRPQQPTWDFSMLNILRISTSPANPLSDRMVRPLVAQAFCHRFSVLSEISISGMQALWKSDTPAFW
jgi:hypothetical protein